MRQYLTVTDTQNVEADLYRLILGRRLILWLRCGPEFIPATESKLAVTWATDAEGLPAQVTAYFRIGQAEHPYTWKLGWYAMLLDRPYTPPQDIPVLPPLFEEGATAQPAKYPRKGVLS